MTDVTRPILRWHGGKWRLAPWIIARFPKHRIYVEPFGGAASVLLRKPPAYSEVYNDLDGEVVNLFRIVRDPVTAQILETQLRLTPFARAEHELAYEPTSDPVERARRLVCRCFMGFGSNGHNPTIKTGFRSNSNRSGTTPAHDWANYPDAMAAMVERLRGVVIERREACEVMAQHDSLETLHYVDPPYVWETRSSAMGRNRCYAHELTDDGHIRLLVELRRLRGGGGPFGLPAPDLRPCPERLDARRTRRPRRRRSAARGSPLDQSARRWRAPGERQRGPLRGGTRVMPAQPSSFNREEAPMELFHVIEDGVVHLRSKGLYRQSKVYRRGRDVFAGYGGGFVRLLGAAGTSKPDVAWDKLEAPGVSIANTGRPVFTASADGDAKAA